MFRFIPAYAGNSARNGSVCRLPSVHPRLRGELKRLCFELGITAGSSPLTRGTRLLSLLPRARLAVHPRLRGELKLSLVESVLVLGSSPLTRGTPSCDFSSSVNGRFIPAYAGNSSSPSISVPPETVHPRLRGELIMIRLSSLRRFGSSPLTRGTRYQLNQHRRKGRFIPAYAGNSLKQGIEHLTNSSKDFLSGKYAKNPETVLNHFKNSSLD